MPLKTKPKYAPDNLDIIVTFIIEGNINFKESYGVCYDIANMIAAVAHLVINPL